ncbi:SusC/RagA family TonB-linked outer membrane protein [Sphingobacterium tabacisoli]|uniref:SusC/RagA family TonB-linked outer membrane protein n=1 Tax=Sphingobacterium tabacisoli TaxID=2044855 RepID=A0ABW5L5F6_9SPHI|nr:SusC/RagA family TonB-linked outer membrane protein [Sphingobacterium tabacisoli]
MRDFLGVGENCPKWWDYSCSKMQNNRYRLLLPLGRSRSDVVFMIFCVLCIGFLVSPAYGQEANGLIQFVLRGEVRSANDGQAIEGVSVTIEKKHARTDKEGRFTISVDKPTGVLTIKHIGYKEQRVAYENTATLLNIALQTGEKQIEEVEVVSTGYQKLAKERATGSFVHIDSALINSRVVTNILNRLDGVAPGLLFDNRGSSPQLHIRGINTMSSASSPLIVLDNFPFEGDINNINPDDIASVTLLRDAAATSIWGARAGNGVIVITSKGGKYGRPQLSFSTSSSLSERVNLFRYPTISSSDFIDIERMLFEKRHYDNTYNNANSRLYVFSPVVELLYAVEKGSLSSEIGEQKINLLRTYDYRNDLEKYVYQTKKNQQYNLSMAGGSDKYRYSLSGGINKEDGEIKGASADRYSLKWTNNIRPFSKLNIGLNVLLANSERKQVRSASLYPLNPMGGKSSMYPYARLVSDSGESLAIPRDYNIHFVDSVGNGALMDWHFRPVDDIKEAISNTKSRYTNLGFQMDYDIFDWSKLTVQYGYEQELSDLEDLYTENSYFTRSLVNRFTQISNGVMNYPIPKGAIMDRNSSRMHSHRLRGQLAIDRQFFEDHYLHLFAGAEFSNKQSESASFRTYGYNTDILTHQQVDYVNTYPMFAGIGGRARIPAYGGFGGMTTRFISMYLNAGYDIGRQFTITASMRKDASNLFGVRTNDRWNPLWSTGAMWTISENKLFKEIPWLDLLKFRLTYGHSGNIAGGAHTETTLTYLPNAQYTGAPYALIANLPNLELKWEDVRMTNMSLEFSLWNRKLSGSLEYFNKLSTDLISGNPIDPTTGFITVNRNVAELKGRGIDLSLSSQVKKANWSWIGSFSLSYVKDIVTKFYGNVGATSTYVTGSGSKLTPLKDKTFYPVFSYRYAGLDPTNGDPQGYYKGDISKNYSQMMRDSLQYLKYHGSGLSPYHGMLRNTLSYKSLELSFNLAFKFGHYFQKQSIGYSGLFNNWASHSDYYDRWQKAGDESNTTVPSMVYPADANRDTFYARSEANIEPADCVRFTDLRLGYSFSSGFSQRKIRWQVFALANNLGILWAKTSTGIDPEYEYSPPVRTFSLGLKVNL